MFLTLAYIVIVAFLVILAVFFRKTLKAMESPQYVLEKPSMTKELKAAMARIEKWREEGRISREEYEKFLRMCEEDAGLPSTSNNDPSEN